MNQIKKLILCLAAVALLGASSALLAEEKTTEAPKPYLLDKCIVSDEKLGEMGKPVVLIHEGREIKFCCKDCVKKFKKEPATYLKRIDEAERAAKK